MSARELTDSERDMKRKEREAAVDELEAFKGAFTELVVLGPQGRRRALAWLEAALDAERLPF
jgi:hypothetical protein